MDWWIVLGVMLIFLFVSAYKVIKIFQEFRSYM